MRQGEDGARVIAFEQAPAIVANSTAGVHGASAPWRNPKSMRYIAVGVTAIGDFAPVPQGRRVRQLHGGPARGGIAADQARFGPKASLAKTTVTGTGAITLFDGKWEGSFVR